MSKNKVSTDLIEKKNAVQAVLIADNFSNSFTPFSHEQPIVSSSH